MSEQNQYSSEEVLKPIVILMKYIGFNQQMPKQKFKLIFIQIYRLLMICTVIKLIVQQFYETFTNISSNSFIYAIIISISYSVTPIIMYCNQFNGILDPTLQLSYKSLRKLKTKSLIFIVFLLFTTLSYIVLDLTKFIFL